MENIANMNKLNMTKKKCKRLTIACFTWSVITSYFKLQAVQRNFATYLAPQLKIRQYNLPCPLTVLSVSLFDLRITIIEFHRWINTNKKKRGLIAEGMKGQREMRLKDITRWDFHKCKLHAWGVTCTHAWTIPYTHDGKLQDHQRFAEL